MGLANREGYVVWFCGDPRLDGFMDFLQQTLQVSPEILHPMRVFGDIHELAGSDPWAHEFFRRQLNTHIVLGRNRLVIAGHDQCKYRGCFAKAHPNAPEAIKEDVIKAFRTIVGWELTFDEMMAFLLPMDPEDSDRMGKPELLLHYPPGHHERRYVHVPAELTV